VRQIKKHIVHCSDSAHGDVGTIRSWHRERGWRDVGYHFVIRRDGEIEVGRTLDEQGAHVKGQNKDSVGTCLIGVNDFTEGQMQALRRLHKMLAELFPGIEVYGHCDFTSAKTCPNFEVREVL
jgi:N-acetyl-anhydromuramyl-L-alanine amidase AmpD